MQSKRPTLCNIAPDTFYCLFLYFWFNMQCVQLLALSITSISHLYLHSNIYCCITLYNWGRKFLHSFLSGQYRLFSGFQNYEKEHMCLLFNKYAFIIRLLELSENICLDTSKCLKVIVATYISTNNVLEF